MESVAGKLILGFLHIHSKEFSIFVVRITNSMKKEIINLPCARMHSSLIGLSDTPFSIRVLLFYAL